MLCYCPSWQIRDFLGELFLVRGFFLGVMSEDLGIFLGPSFTSRSTPPGIILAKTCMVVKF